MSWRIDHYVHIVGAAGDTDFLNRLKGDIMASQSELAASIRRVTENVAKIGGETRSLLSKIQALTDAMAAAGGTTPEVDAAMADLQAQVVVVDGLVQDPETPAPDA